jgi:hypothetical protein
MSANQDVTVNRKPPLQAIAKKNQPYISGFDLSALAPLIIPSMKPITNPPPMITLGTENAIIIVPHAFLFASLPRSISEPNNIIVPHISPTTVRAVKGTASLDVPGIVGIVQGNQVVAAPKSAALINIRIPAIREKAEALRFSLRLMRSHIILGFGLFCSTYEI